MLRLETMRITKTVLLIFVLLLNQFESLSCSMYKVTAEGKTMVGCNHDTWLTTPKIWFETAKLPNEYGAAFTGAREVNENKTTPQSGMNTSGLAFSRLASTCPTQKNPFMNRLKISNEADYLTDILHKCSSVEEVKKYIEQYDHSYFIDAIFIYIDSLGDYLIVEPYKLIKGNDPNYVLANFCPSLTDKKQARKFDRYRNGEDFLLRNKTIPSLAYCTALSDTMHVCRERIGDGTLLTSIWDTQDKIVSLYFYHSYDTSVQFNLISELKKGDHLMSVPVLFPTNSEFEKLVALKTPSNTVEIRILLVFFAGILGLVSIVLSFTQILKNRVATVSLKSTVAIALLNSILFAYIIVLITNREIFYFAVPYTHYNSSWITVSSYTPFLLLLTFGPNLMYSINCFKSDKISTWIKGLLVSNNVAYLVLIVGFAYWGLYNFWS